ncbi:voltage-dependent calcium channel gamma-5 subunit isoform X2 [Planococcus citri]|uniref:voltage-dependent calcium channel gamma-5 subunit isoform X2 n=1 Tax=Planococcus citri TaxID=170843 RepID=UPI0031F8933A
MGKVISFLWVLTPISSTISVIIVWVAMATSDWIRTQERILNLHYNGSADNKYILKMTYSGIWEICTVTDGDTDISCEIIHYFSSEPYYPDPADSSVVIPYAVRQSVFFFIVASLVQLFGELGYLYGHYVRYRKVFIFIGGTIFIVSGLVMLIGMVMYISIFKSEVGSKFKHSSDQSRFNYQYGVSFVLYVSGFVCVELSGTCAVLLFVCQDQSVQSVHFIQPSPVIYRNYNTTATNPSMIYPCQKHSDLCVAMDTLSHHSEHLYPSQREEVEINHHYYSDSDSPPYAPADQLSQYGDYSYHYREPERPSTSMQSTTTQTVSTIYDPYAMNDAETESNATDYQQREAFVSYDMNNIPLSSSTEKMNTLRKSTLV